MEVPLEYVRKVSSRDFLAPRAFAKLFGCPRVLKNVVRVLGWKWMLGVLNEVGITKVFQMQVLCTLLGCLGKEISTTCLWASGSKLRLGLLNEIWYNAGGSNANTATTPGTRMVASPVGHHSVPNS